MPAIRIVGFDGVVPRVSPTMLGPNQAQVADNVKLYSKELRCWRGPALEYEPGVSGVQSIYKMSSPEGHWLTWTGDVDVVPGPQTDTSELRLYYTGDGAPKKTNLLMATASAPYPTEWLYMGVPPPVTAPFAEVNNPDGANHVLTVSSYVVADDSGEATSSLPFLTHAADGESSQVLDGPHPSGGGFATYLTVNELVGVSDDGSIGGDGDITTSFPSNASTPFPDDVEVLSSDGSPESRVYVYTYVAQFGAITEESAPSPPSNLVDVPPGQAVTVSGFATVPTTGYNITARRIYRSVTGATSDSYQFVDEIPLAQTSYVDTKSVADLAEVLGTEGWLPPPDNLTGLVQHPSGALVGFEGNTVYFSEPGFPHAWPLEYALTVPYDIVAIGIFATSVVVATERHPFIFTGPYPGAMGREQVPLVEPCVSKRSLVSDEMGVSYASPNGLVTIGPAIRGVVTEKLFRRTEWEAEGPSTMVGLVYDGKYIAMRPDRKALVLSRNDVPALSYLTMDGTAAFVSGEEAKLYYMGTDAKIYAADTSEIVLNNYQWRSKRIVVEKGVTFSALRLDAVYDQTLDEDAYNEYVNGLIAENEATFAAGDVFGSVNASAIDTYTVNGSAMHDLPPMATPRTVSVLIYGDGVLMATLSPENYDPVRVPPFRCREVEFELIGNVDVRSLIVATSVRELYTDGA